MKELIQQAKSYVDCDITDCHGFELDLKAINALSLIKRLNNNITISQIRGDSEMVKELTNLLREVKAKQTLLIEKAKEEF